MYLCTRHLGPPFAGHENKQNALIWINVYLFVFIHICEKVGCLKKCFDVLGVFCAISCYFECANEIQCKILYI